MTKTSLFKSNKTQAVRLPKDVAFSEDVKEVEVLVVGESRIITPAKTSWASWFSGEPASEDFMVEREQPASEDFMVEREQPEEQERDPL